MDMSTAAAEEADVSPLLDPSHAPLLLFDHVRETAGGQQASDANKFFLYSIPKKQVLVTRVDGIRDHRYWTTPQGWLVMAACGSPDMFLWDPFTGTRISLPPNRDGFLTGNGHWRCLLSRKPVDVADAAHPMNCTVDVLALSPEGTVFWHCRLGRDKRWVRHEYNERPFARLSTLNGRFIMCFDNKVVTMELSTEQTVVFSEIPVSTEHEILLPCTCFHSQMVDSRGDLFCVRFFLSDLQGRAIAGIGVSKLDLSAGVWMREELLDGRVFIVLFGQYCASLDDPREGLDGDCIYYCLPGDKAVYVYSMSRGTTTSRNPGSCLLDHHSPMLFMPTC